MNAIDFKDQTSTVETIVRGLTHPDAPRCWCVVMPPGFADEEALARQIAGELRRVAPTARAAIISADTINSRESYCRELRRQWLGRSAKPDEGEANLQRLLGALTPEAPAFQILIRFQKILDALDQSILGELREAEQGHRLRTVTICHYPYYELKTRWRAHKHFFCVSDYGDTHLEKVVEPISFDELRNVLLKRGYPPWLVEFAAFLTGGYPAVVAKLIDLWQIEGRPDPRPDVRRKLRVAVEKNLRRMVEGLDYDGEMRFRESVVNLYHGIEPGLACYRLSAHPWNPVLLAGDTLRAEGIGSVAVVQILESVAQSAGVGDTHDLWRRGCAFYEQGQYGAVARMLEKLQVTTLRPHLGVLAHHARIMELLYGGEADSSGFDTNWVALAKAIVDARTFIKTNSVKIVDAAMLEDRLETHAKMAAIVQRALKSGARVIDTLAGVRGGEFHPKIAVLLLLMHLEAAQRIPGPSTACQIAMALPEQILRTWAVFALQINYDNAPHANDAAWDRAQNEWQIARPKATPLRRAAPEDRFPSLDAFAYFAFALLSEGKRSAGLFPEANFAALDGALQLLDIRRDNAHALALSTDTRRDKYFVLINRWLDALIAACPEATTRESLLADMEPLPLVDEAGMLI